MNNIKKVVIYLTPDSNDDHIIYYQLLQMDTGSETLVKKDYHIQ